MSSPSKPRSIDIPANLNLDYLPIGEVVESGSTNVVPPKFQLNDSAWEKLLTNIDSGHSSIYNGLYGGISADESPLQRYHTAPTIDTGGEWAQEAWPEGAIDMTSKGAVPQSVLSFSEESLTSGEDLVFSTSGSNNGSMAQENGGSEETFKGITIPNCEDFEFDEYDTPF